MNLIINGKLCTKFFSKPILITNVVVILFAFLKKMIFTQILKLNNFIIQINNL